MNPITQVQNQAANSPIANVANKETTRLEQKTDKSEAKEAPQPVLNKMSRQLNEKSNNTATAQISGSQAQQLLPTESSTMMGAQSGNITPEFVANLLNKSPYQQAG